MCEKQSVNKNETFIDSWVQCCSKTRFAHVGIVGGERHFFAICGGHLYVDSLADVVDRRSSGRTDRQQVAGGVQMNPDKERYGEPVDTDGMDTWT